MEPNEMRRHRLPLDSATLDRLLDGRLDPHDAPPGYARVAAVVSSAGGGFADEKVDGALLGALVQAIDESPQPTTERKPTTMISKLRAAKVATATTALVLASAGVAAAAGTGTLPDPAQDAVSHAVSHLGFDLPTSEGTHPTADDHPSADDHPTPEHPTADDHPSGDDHPTGNADNPTDADQHGADVSDVARNSDTTGADHGAAVSEVARAGHGKDETSTTEVETDGPDEHASSHASEGAGNAEDHPTATDNPGTSHRP